MFNFQGVPKIISRVVINAEVRRKTLRFCSNFWGFVLYAFQRSLVDQAAYRRASGRSHPLVDIKGPSRTFKTCEWKYKVIHSSAQPIKI